MNIIHTILFQRYGKIYCSLNKQKIFTLKLKILIINLPIIFCGGAFDKYLLKFQKKIIKILSLLSFSGHKLYITFCEVSKIFEVDQSTQLLTPVHLMKLSKSLQLHVCPGKNWNSTLI